MSSSKHSRTWKKNQYKSLKPWKHTCLENKTIKIVLAWISFAQLECKTTAIYWENKFWRHVTKVSVISWLQVTSSCVHNDACLETNILRGRRARDRMVVGFTSTYTIGACHHWCCGFDCRSGRGVQHYVIKFVSDLRQVGGFFRILRFPPTIKPLATI